MVKPVYWNGTENKINALNLERDFGRIDLLNDLKAKTSHISLLDWLVDLVENTTHSSDWVFAYQAIDFCDTRGQFPLGLPFNVRTQLTSLLLRLVGYINT